MRATRSSVFVQAIVIAVLALKHEWAAVVAPLAVLHLLWHMARSPKLVAVQEHPGQQAAHVRGTASGLVYRLHHPTAPRAPRVPVNPTPGDPFRRN